MMMKTMRSSVTLVWALLWLIVPVAGAQQQTYTVSSPDGKTAVTVAAGEVLTIAISHNGEAVLEPSPVSMVLAGNVTLGASPKILRAREEAVNSKIIPVVPEKRSVIPDVYHQLTLECEGGYALLVRAYDDGVAYRFHTELSGEITVVNENLTAKFATDDSVWFPQEESFLTHSERLYYRRAVRAISDTQMCCLPAVVTTRSGLCVALAEADLLDYPGLYLRGAGDGTASLKGLLPGYPETEERVRDRTVKVTKRAPYIARTKGTRDFPWRIVAIAEHDGDLVANDIVYRLGSPCVLTETGWIKPGKVAWDWWNANNVYGVPFRAGINTATYKYYIDFASTNHLEYVIFDEGWSAPADLFAINPDMDMEGLFAYAKQKNVGIILWMTWTALDEKMEPALDRFAAWGAKGIKVDFMQRDDQKMVNYYERVARECAKRHLLVDFHGAYKPSGFSRTFPHALTREGVRGLENDKWSQDITPAHDVTLPFTRMFAGPMDYTPGAMRNASKEDFVPVFNEPMSQGTRCHQLAMYVVFESPLQMLADCPSAYMREPEAMQFLSSVPTVWDETRVLGGKIGEYVAVARRRGTTWYIGAMTNWDARDLALDLSFLKDAHTLTVYEDGINADRHGSDYVRKEVDVKADAAFRIHLAPGGGWVAVVR